MRVAVVTTSFPSHPGDPSGHFVQASARALAREGAEVHVVAAGGSLRAPPRRLEGDGDGGAVWVHQAGGGVLFGWPGAIVRLKRAPWRLAGALSFFRGASARLASI